MKHRPEIDGLRAIAVIAVILFHAKWPGFEGGFVGVDVFFVISGYLIASIIIRERDAGSFSLLSFYDRRMRRILPALYLVVLLTLPFIWLLYLPEDMKDYSESLAAVPLFVSNFILEAQSGYFDRASDIKPLIHTWSLAVEIQFYLLFPAFFLLLYRFGPRAILIGSVVLGGLSLALAEWGTTHAPTDSFFHLPTRIWEFFVGVLVALYFRKSEGGLPSDALGFLGIAMICASVVLYNTQTPFPGVYALMPVLGTALVILCTRSESLSGRLLSNRLFVGIGLISYSLYLWHQPILALATYQLDGHLGFGLSVVLICLSFGLSIISWKFCEKPFRNRSRVPGRPFLGSILAASVVFLGVGLYGAERDGDLQRFDTQTLRIANPPSSLRTPLETQADGAILLGDTTQTPTIIFAGDSHTAVLMQALNYRLKDANMAAVMYLTGPCPPLFDVQTTSKRGPQCRETVDAFKARATQDDNIDNVVLHAQWSNYTTGTRWGRRSLRFLADDTSITESLAENLRVFTDGLTRTLAQLTPSKRVMIVKSVPEYEVLVPNFLAKKYHQTGQMDEGRFLVTKTEFDTRNAIVASVFSQLPAASNLVLVSAFEVFCPDGYCRMFDDAQNVLYNDANHLSEAGTLLLVNSIMPLLLE